MLIWPVAACMAAVLAFSDAAMDAALAAARVFCTAVMPALLPMLVLGEMWPFGQKAEHLQLTAYSFAAGSPASARQLRALWDAGRLRRPLRMLALCGVMSPMFFTGTLPRLCGAPGLRMLACHWGGAALAALMLPGKDPRPAPAGMQPPARTRPSLPAAVASAMQALLGVCGAMMVFSTAMGVTRAALARLAPAWTAAHAPVIAVLWALVEIGGGAWAVCDAFAAPPHALLAGLCGFGGLGIWLQNLLFLHGRINPVKLLCIRALHGVISMGLYLLTDRFFA